MLVETYYDNKTITWSTKDIHTYERQKGKQSWCVSNPNALDNNVSSSFASPTKPPQLI